MHRILLTLAALALGVVPAFAFDTPKALLEALYAPYSAGDTFDWSNWDAAALRSAELNKLFDADEKEADGEVGRLDFDPYINGQDYDIKKLKIGEATVDGDTATEEVTFNNLDTANDLTFTLVKEADGWKVDDVVSADKDNPYSLKALMSAPL